MGKKPGLKEFTLAPSFAHSLAKFLIKLVIFAFAAEYANAFDNGGPAEVEKYL